MRTHHLALAATLAACGNPPPPTDTFDTAPPFLEQEDDLEQASRLANPGPLVITGKLSFEPDYSLTDGTPITTDLGQIPGSNSAYAKMRHLFLCAYEADQAADFDVRSDTPFAGNDDLLACTRADVQGNYTMLMPTSPRFGDDIYLLTWFCDDADFELTTEFGITHEDLAQVCVRHDVNTEPSSSDSGLGRHRKFLRSRIYHNTLPQHGTLVLNWNLSCPDVDGQTGSVDYLDCPAGTVEPRTSENCQHPAFCPGGTNSSWGWNQEAIHIFRAAIEPIKTFGTITPDSGNVSMISSPCTDFRCQDEISLVINNDDIPLGRGNRRVCSASTNNSSSGYNRICITHEGQGDSGTHNPFRVVHEIGHNVHRRWLKDNSKISQGCSNVGWASGSSESHATAEGFANFFATASWYNDDMSNPTYDGHAVESSGDIELAGTCGSGTTCGCTEGTLLGEGRPTQFFWDLYDDNDGVDLSFWDIMATWSAFSPGTGDGDADECGPHGRNIEDFQHHYNLLRGLYGWPAIRGLMTTNCVDRHIDGMVCDPGCIGGDCPPGVCD